MLKTASLVLKVKEIVINKGTEYCYSGIYHDLMLEGTYLCRNCGLALFRSQDKFHSGTGWPSFDCAINRSVDQIPDADKIRTELLCHRCQGHLGHVFYGEGYTKLNTRYCINSLALELVRDSKVIDTEEAIVAAGCFWGVEHLFQNLAGVLKTEVGYIGGSVDNPNYDLVCQTDTGHVEAVRILYDPSVKTYSQIMQYFFEVHDFTQANGQGGDIGAQYLSKIFYFNDEQYKYATKIIKTLKAKGYQVATSLESMQPFWPAEDYHQEYYRKNGNQPYCHFWRKVF